MTLSQPNRGIITRPSAAQMLAVTTIARPTGMIRRPLRNNSARLAKNSSAMSRNARWLVNTASPITSITGPISRAMKTDVDIGHPPHAAWASVSIVVSVIASQRVGAKRRPMTGSAKQSGKLSFRDGALTPDPESRDSGFDAFASPRNDAVGNSSVMYGRPPLGMYGRPPLGKDFLAFRQTNRERSCIRPLNAAFDRGPDGDRGSNSNHCGAL